jgi:hypothetical protein
MRALILALVAGCAGGDTTDDDDGGTTDTDVVTPWDCADPVYFDASFRGRVTRDGAPAAGADVRIEERNWAPGTVHGSGTSNEQGTFDIPATEMPIVEGCWGWATGFFVVAEQDGLSDDWPVNAVVTSAWIADESVITLEGFSLELE